MSRLKVVLRGTVISQIELSTEKEYIGGRKEGCDIRLQPEKGISREHFKLKFSDGKWQIVAISRFGDVFSLGQKIEQADLQHGQSFHVPPYDFTFLELPDAGLPNALAQKIPLEISENEKTVLGAAPQVPYIKVVNSAGDVREMLRLEVGEVWVAGRDPSCQIIIPDQRVSRRQFEVYKVNGAYTILDLASVNGTFLNGSPVSSTDPQTLKSGDAISVLDNTMYFELHDPNFKYKVDNIEIPPLQVESEQLRSDNFAPVIEEVAGETEIVSEIGESSIIEDYDEDVAEGTDVAIEEVEEHGNLPQIQAGEGPFTGMPPNQGFDPNQYYTFNQQAGPIPGAGTQGPIPPPPQTPVQKITKNRPLFITLVILFLGGAYWLSEYLNQPEEVAQVVINESDPFSQLNPEKQKEVQELYTLAEQMYNQQKYDLALEKIRKLKEILPQGYKDSEKIEIESDQAYMTLVQKQKDDEALKAREERDAKNKQIMADCEKLLGPKITGAEMSQCLAPVTAIDPNMPDHVRLMAEAERIQAERERKEQEEKNYEEKVQALKELFDVAEKTQAQGYAFKAIKQYKTVVGTELPDPKKLKSKAEKRIEFIESKIREKSESSISTADSFVKEGKLKDAIVTLREAVVYDPDNADIKEKIDAYTYELTRQVRVIYQESIIDENYGMIENTETKVGAKEKWKKITETDLEDGEYYKKAVFKLRRYGVL
jgi:tetratricopeptide (TPR) repeat protein